MLFDNYNKFENAFQKYKQETLQMYTIQTSQLNHACQDDPGKRYKMIIFSCIRSGDTIKSKGEDIR
jgi:hypothetical protein